MIQTVLFAVLSLLMLNLSDGYSAELKVLFLGDTGPHRPRERFAQLQPVLNSRNIKLTYTGDAGDLNPKTLAGYDVLLLYANINRIEPDQEKSLLEYVAAGGGFVPLHCATFCFRNSKDVVALMGAQFRRHGTGVFRTEIANSEHPIMKGFGGFESWDETYVHHLHNEKDRTVLAFRVDEQGREPWTWVRTHGKGRVFYTAWGHDQRTWGHPGFQNLLERGIRWAARADLNVVPNFSAERPFPIPQMTAKRKDVKPFEFLDVGAKIPNYTPGRRWGTQGVAFSKMQKPIPAEESLKHMVVPQGFRVELFAAEPDIGGKPICMTWDERGRLWIAETYDYPNQQQPPGQGRDRIRILEDTDGDWKADTFTIFAEKLSIPTSITFHRGGVIVNNGTQTLFLKDTDGDDVADERRVLFSGWNQADTHGGVSNFQYGLDNWIWAMQGYNNSEPVINGEKQQSFRMGFFRFRPDGSQIEFLRSTNNNTWGLGISEEGIIFGSTANRNPSFYMPIPNRYYEAVRGWAPSLTLSMIADTHLFKPVTENIRQMDHHGGYTAAAGHALYTARNYPQEYWNRTAFVNGPTGHLVGTFVLKRDGSDFHSTSSFNLLASDDEWTAPIMSEVGPDGNVWVIDWYNYIVQHNPTPRGFQTGKGNAYLTDLRDKKHGRIYRVVYEATQPVGPMSLGDATPEQLVDSLKHDNMFWRRQAQRLLVERGKQDVLPALIDLAGDRHVDEIGLNTGVIHALWTMHGLGSLDGSHAEATAAAVAALKHPSAGVRRNAVQVLPRTVASTEAIVSGGLLLDSDAQVRLAAFLALADLPPSPAAGRAVVSAMNQALNANDRWIPDAATSSAANNSENFLRTLAGSQKPSAKLTEISEIVAEHYARGIPVDTVAGLVAKLTRADAAVADAVIKGLAKGWPNGKRAKMDPSIEQDFERLQSHLSLGSRGLFLNLASSWGIAKFEKYAKEVSTALLAQLDDRSLADDKRVEVARQIVEFLPLDAETVTQLLDRVSPQTSPAVATGIVRALEGSESPQAGRLIVERFRSMTPLTRRAGIFVLLSRSQSTGALLEGAEKGQIQLSELSLDQKQSLAYHPKLTIRRRARRLLSRGGALPNPDRLKVLNELLPLTKRKGDAVAGKEVYKKHCAKCHVHSGEGTRIGPDLTGMAVHPKDELLTHIIDPSRSVEGNYRVYSVVTKGGLVLNGLLASETKTAIELFDAEGKKKTVLREEIEELVASSKSLMPDGFEKQVRPDDISNLLEFLTERGKYVPIDLRKAATITTVRGMFFTNEGTVERLVFPDWSPKTFKNVPFHLVDPQEGRVANAILLYGPNGPISAKMPQSVELPCNGPVRAIHMLSGVSGWGHPLGRKGSTSMIVRLHYDNGATEDHQLKNGIHFADYIRRVDVPESEFAFMLRGRQLRYLSISPKRNESIERIELIKGEDRTAPIVMAVTIETR